MTLSLRLKGSLKLLLLVTMFFIVLNIVDAQDFSGLGCCVGRSLDGDYCSAVFDNECEGSWLSNPNFYDRDRKCVGLSGNNDDLCSQVCCEIGGIGNEMSRAECIDKEGSVEGVSCSNDLKDITYCLLDNECVLRTSRQCGAENVRNSLIECQADLAPGCIVGSDGSTCRSGVSGTENFGEFFVNSLCGDVIECSNCRGYSWSCEDGVEFQTSACGDIKNSNECLDDSYCGTTGRCILNVCNEKVDYTSWCLSNEDISLPRDRHSVFGCVQGNEEVIDYCDEYRGVRGVCEESIDSDSGKIGARCVDNDWRRCFGIDNQDGCDGNCVWQGNECLPKYPPGVEFWLKDKPVSIVSAPHWDELMCSLETTLGCARSGDCIGGTGGVVLDEPVVDIRLPENVVKLDEVWSYGDTFLNLFKTTDSFVDVRFRVPENPLESNEILTRNIERTLNSDHGYVSIKLFNREGKSEGKPIDGRVFEPGIYGMSLNSRQYQGNLILKFELDIYEITGRSSITGEIYASGVKKERQIGVRLR